MNSNFCIFILSHGRPDNVRTVKTLIDSGYSGDYFILVDNLDASLDRYKINYGDKVIVFDKHESAKETDAGDNFKKMNSVIYARNVCHKVCRELGYEYFLELDDDYTQFRFRVNDELCFDHRPITNINPIFESVLKFLDKTNATSVAFAQGGDYIGGESNYLIKDGPKLKRKAMNTFFCRSDREFKFVGIMNDDVNTYISLGNKGHLFLTIPQICVEQMDTQSQAGGLTELYLDQGTYVKSFYSVMFCPSFVKISVMGNNDKRIHHKIKWKNAVPKILSEDYKK